MGSIALDGCHKLRNEVIALLQLYVDVGKRVLAVVAHSYQIVIDSDNPEDYHRYYD